MTTMHEQGARSSYMKLMQKPGGPDVVAQLTANVAAGHYDGELCDVMGSGHWLSSARTLPMEQMLMIGLAHVDICSGEIIRTKVRAAGEPHRDSAREANALALADLPHPFTAEVNLTQHGGDSDGAFRWSEPVRMSACIGETTPGEDGRPVNLQEIVTAAPQTVPLEIGSTLPSRTLMHLREARGVARWPYGSDWVFVWLWIGPDRRRLPSMEEVQASIHSRPPHGG